MAGLTALTLTVLSNCGAYGRGFGALDAAACPELGGNADALRAQYATNVRVNGKIRAFVQAAKDVGAVSLQIEAEAAEACQRMGLDLGMTSQEMAAKNEPGGRASGSCAALSAKIDALFRAGISVRATATPPHCEVSAQASASCQGACDVEIDPGEIAARCDPGKLSGYCQGQCGGHCDGRCSGACNGTCSARDAKGACVGACSGDCTGACDASCHARCQGAWQAPEMRGVRSPSERRRRVQRFVPRTCQCQRVVHARSGPGPSVAKCRDGGALGGHPASESPTTPSRGARARTPFDGRRACGG